MFRTTFTRCPPPSPLNEFPKERGVENSGSFLILEPPEGLATEEDTGGDDGADAWIGVGGRNVL